MKMTIKQAIDALAGVIALQKKQMDYETARGLLTWKRFLQSEMANATEFERQQMDLFGGVLQQNKSITFETEENRAQFLAAMEQMRQTEIEIDLKPIDLSKIGGGERLMLTGEVWALLEPIVLKTEETA